ncbi:MAG: calcium-binding protein, partial [Acetobacteraceae bacterium]
IPGKSVITGADGAYRFTGLAPGSYGVQFVTPSGMVPSPADAAADDLDSDASVGTGKTPVKAYVSGDVDNSVDAGFYVPTGLGDRVFLDTNGNGIQDGGEQGIDGVTVTLLDGSGIALPGRVTTTAGGGAYRFTGLVPGDYKVQFAAPGGYAFTARDQGSDLADSDANPVTGITGTYTLVSGQIDNSVDAGLYQPVSIGDRAWIDVNGDGIQGLGEPGLAGVTVTLINDATGATASRLTDASGNYLFTGLPPGSYHEVFGAPAGTVFTRTGAGTAATDSDPNASGVGPGFSIGSGQADLTRDAGLYVPPKIGATNCTA